MTMCQAAREVVGLPIGTCLHEAHELRFLGADNESFINEVVIGTVKCNGMEYDDAIVRERAKVPDHIRRGD